MIVDDHLLFRRGIRLAMQEYPDVEVIGEATNGQELLDKLETEQPDVLTMDLRMPVMDGLEALEHVRKKYPRIRVIILCMFEDPAVIAYVMEKGAHGYLTCAVNKEQIYETIITCFDKGYCINDLVRNALVWKYYKFKKPAELSITEKELLIVQQLEANKSVASIAGMMDLSPRTVTAMIEKLKNKTNTRSVAVMIALVKSRLK